MHHFQTEQWLPFPRDLVFRFFANPANLPPLMPRWQQARIDEVTLQPPPPPPEGSPTFPSPVAGSGTSLVITARALPGLPLRGSWHARIEDFRWNEGFCDVQLRGPFAYWKHCHTVHDAPQNGAPGTLLRDHVTYALPIQRVSSITLPAVQLACHQLFAYRHRQTMRLLPLYAQQAQRIQQ